MTTSAATRATVVAAALAAFMIVSGCVSQKRYDSLHDKFLSEQARVEELGQANEALAVGIVARDKQILTLQALGSKRLEKLYHVQRIELGRHSSGVDLDNKPGHDAVRVYLSPIDQQGSVIKAPGAVKIQLFDLTADDGPKLIGTYEWSIDDVSRQWASFVMYHYSFTCKWPAKPPAVDEVTVRVEFIDYLTGKKFTAQRVCRITTNTKYESRNPKQTSNIKSK